jgi:hypothetical protein
MREEKFEKQVREKMEQLGFDPSESVWVNVNKEINQEKKRRPIFWLFFLPALLLAGTVYYVNNHSGGAKADNPVLKVEDQKENKPLANKSEVPPIQNKKESKENSATGDGQDDINKRKISLTKSLDHKMNQASDHFLIHKTGSNKKHPAFYTNFKSTNSKEIKESFDDSKTPASVDIVIKNYDGHSAESDKSKNIIDSASLKTVTGIAENKQKKDSVTSAPVAKNKEQKTKPSHWKIGYTVSGGVSNLNQNLFNSVKTLSAVNYAAGPQTPVNAAPANYSSSLINPGFSFAAGVFITKNISDRISISGGINYHYYSTTIKTGIKINTTLFTSNSLNRFIASNSYYENSRSRTYSNQYHLIEIPLSANFQINKSKRMPFIWELGITPGYIVGSKALYYDPNTNVYFSNYEQPNKMQLNGTTALMFGLPFHKGQLQLGPQVQYGFTGFINSNDGNPGHLFYAGLKISFIPGKK